MAKKRKTNAKKAARKLPSYMQDIAFSKHDAKGERAYRNRRMGTFGAASECISIDPAEYERQRKELAS